MQGGNQTDQRVSNKSQAQDIPSRTSAVAGSSRRSSVSTRSQKHSPNSSQAESQTPLTPEESPPFSRKRTAAVVEEEDKEIDNTDATPANQRQSSVCICPPDPKIPRPRNAFILYRQHRQAEVVAQNPGLANPEISKLIGEEWQNQPPEIKNKWKALAEEEKTRHQQQYPGYRYQPKRNGRRNSVSSQGTSGGEKPRCPACGGKSILAPSTPYAANHSNNPSPASATPHTPGSIITPISRTLPVLKDLSLQSPAARGIGRHFAGITMPSNHNGHTEDRDRDEVGPLSPDAKRRRFNGDYPPTSTRVVPPRYAVAPPPGAYPGPGTPFPFSQAPPHPYPPGANPVRRESLPGLRGVVNGPGAMAPPPRPGPGMQQHRMSQGHVAHDRSLTLPPLQTSNTGGVAGAVATACVDKSAEEQIMSINFKWKINILRSIAPPAPVKKAALRGPLLAVEGDSVSAVKELGDWLCSTLRKGDDLTVSLMDGPTLSGEGGKEVLMSRYHRLAAEWLEKSIEIKDSLACKIVSPTDSVMLEATPTAALASKVIAVQEIDDGEDASNKARSEPKSNGSASGSSERANSDAEKMDVDIAVKPSRKDTQNFSTCAKPVRIITNYSLHASNFFARHIPIDSHDLYAPMDHWKWSATQWRGIISPDLTIYVRDGVSSDGAKQSVDIFEGDKLIVVKRTNVEGREALEVEASTMRRLGFEVSEWVRDFGSKAD